MMLESPAAASSSQEEAEAHTASVQDEEPEAHTASVQDEELGLTQRVCGMRN